MSMVLVGAILGSVCSGPVADMLGRKNTILANNSMYIIGPLLMSFSVEYLLYDK